MCGDQGFGMTKNAFLVTSFQSQLVFPFTFVPGVPGQPTATQEKVLECLLMSQRSAALSGSKWKGRKKCTSDLRDLSFKIFTC